MTIGHTFFHCLHHDMIKDFFLFVSAFIQCKPDLDAKKKKVIQINISDHRRKKEFLECHSWSSLARTVCSDHMELLSPMITHLRSELSTLTVLGSIDGWGGVVNGGGEGGGGMVCASPCCPWLQLHLTWSVTQGQSQRCSFFLILLISAVQVFW